MAGLEPSMIAVKGLELLGEFLRDKFRGKNQPEKNVVMLFTDFDISESATCV